VLGYDSDQDEHGRDEDQPEDPAFGGSRAPDRPWWLGGFCRSRPNRLASIFAFFSPMQLHIGLGAPSAALPSSSSNFFAFAGLPPGRLFAHQNGGGYKTMKKTLIPSALSLIVLVALLLALAPVPVMAQNAPQGDSGSAKVEAQQGGGTSGGGTSTTRTTTTTWSADPVWIGLGIVVLILVILLIVFASRRGDRTTTTVIKD